jgi:hypothetical protein
MHQRIIALLGILTIAASACSTVAPASVSPIGPATPVLPSEFVPTVVPSTPTFDGCAYVWASQQLPELSRLLNSSLQKISADVTGLAYAYGENCVYGDGHETFSAMETDYRIGVKVKDIHDEAALGDWIAKVMLIVDALPAAETQGPQPGRVDFDFKQPDPADLFISVPIEKYHREAKGLKGVELFRLFYSNP